MPDSEPPNNFSYVSDSNLALPSNFIDYFNEVNRVIKNFKRLSYPPTWEDICFYPKEIIYYQRLFEKHEDYITNLLEAQVNTSSISGCERRILIKYVPKLVDLRKRVIEKIRDSEKR